jgi:hypothetical protein
MPAAFSMGDAEKATSQQRLESVSATAGSLRV